MHTFLSEKIKWYEEHVNEYFLDTIYNTDKLMVEVPEDKWFEINPTRGMREGICSYELIGSGTEIADFLICSYGETEYDRMIIDKRIFRFSRRRVAAGGALYPNVLYLLIKKNGKMNIYQFDPALGLLRWLRSSAIDDDLFKENTCYFIATIYYWRNWLKYRYFGYRLMNVDTGYLLANLYVETGKRGLKGMIHISQRMFVAATGYIGIDSGEEGIGFVIEVDSKSLADSVDKLSDNCEYKIFKDWDTEDIPLYAAIETAALGQSYNISEKISGKGKEHIFASEYLFRNRVSPGGAVMQSIFPVEKNLLTRTLVDLTTILADVKNLTEDIRVYVCIKKVQGFGEGIYCYSAVSENSLEFIRSIDADMQIILKKHNFDLNDTPALIFVGYKADFDFASCSESEFKLIQLKVGFVSHMITVAAAVNDCYTHPILGFDVELSEQLTGEKHLLNLIAFSDKKNLDRQQVIYRK